MTTKKVFVLLHKTRILAIVLDVCLRGNVREQMWVKKYTFFSPVRFDAIAVTILILFLCLHCWSMGEYRSPVGPKIYRLVPRCGDTRWRNQSRVVLSDADDQDYS